MKSANTPQPDLAVAKVAPVGEIAKPSDVAPMSFDIESIFKYAIEHQGSGETLKDLMQVRRELRAESAKQLFDAAMSIFQSKCPAISKSKPVQDNSGKRLYAYAPIERIEEIIRPIESECGFTHTFDQDVTSREGWVIVKCTVTHTAGHTLEKTAMFPLGTKTQIMSNTQQYAAALTFANRRVLSNAYGLVFLGEDKDGGSQQKPAGPSTMRPATEDLKPLARELWEVLKSVRGTKQDWTESNNWLWANEILDPGVPDLAAPHLTAEQFRETIKKAKAKLGVK